MHFCTLVVVPPGYDGDIGEYVDRAMAPYDESLEIESVTEDGETWWINPDSFWDWYQIGGRWSGHLSRDYDPERDPRNWETCTTCGGTGARADGVIASVKDGKPYCNACTGSLERTGRPGVRVKWPTQWVSDTGNVARLGDVREWVEGQGSPYYLLHEGLSQQEHVIDAIRKLSDDCTVVVVDCHC